MKKFAVILINFYQKYLSFDTGVLSYFAPGGACKFKISCSQYTKEKIEEFGVFKGSLLGLKRLWRCR